MFAALLIVLLILAGAATILGGGLLLLAQKRRELPEGRPRLLPRETADLPERNLRDLRPGDVVQQGQRDWLVEGVISYEEDGTRWIASRVTDGERTGWIVAGLEARHGDAAALLHRDESIEITGYPPETIVVDELRYRLQQRGTAICKFLGDVGPRPGRRDTSSEVVSRCRWWRYDGAGDDRLLIEQWNGVYWALRGKRLGSGEIDIIPGS
jgi:hypothetical protein